MTFAKAKTLYVHRFTMEHKPRWANKPLSNGMFYAPQYESDKEWYENTTFPPSERCFGTDCHSGNPTWPLGMFLNYSF